MKVTMLQNISGTRNSQRWPAIGHTIDLPSDEAQQLVDNGYAEPTGKPAKPAEKATAEPKGEKRKR